MSLQELERSDAPQLSPQAEAVPETPDQQQEVWKRVKERIRIEVGEDIYQSWFARMDLERVKKGTAYLSVPTRFLKSWTASHYKARILECYQAERLDITKIEIEVRSAIIRSAPKPQVPKLLQPSTPVMDWAAQRARLDSVSMSHHSLGGSPLDPRFALDTFVVGGSNTLAHAAAKQIADAHKGEPAMFNPLYIHAGVGLGKTHLLQAIAWGSNEDRTILYLTAEKFMYGFVSAMRMQTALAFREALRGIDVLVIDDLQFLQGKSTQAEFCHTLNALMDAGRQVVIAADRSPNDLENLDDHVRSRLAAGLVVDMGPLGEDVRLEVLKKRVEAARHYHPGFDISGPVLSYIARSLTHNGRDLDGAVNRLLAHNKLTGQPVTMELAEREIRDLIRPAEPRRVKIEDIQRVVARQYNVSRADLLSSRRTANIVRPRQVAMYLAKTMTLRSLPEIGRRFGNRDHTTVLHAVRKIEGLVANDAMLADEIEVLKRQLQS